MSGAGNGAPFRRRIMDTGGGRCFGRAAVSGREMAKLHRIGCPVRFTLLPFRAVGTAAGLLLAACSDYIEVNGKRYPRTPVALSEQAVSDGGGYHALWGAMEGGIGHGKASDLAETPVAQRIQAG